jgi:chromosome partitioning protein
MIISLVSFKGGVSKTTTSVHLAAYLSRRGKTLLVDGDPNESATEWIQSGEFSFVVTSPEGAAPESQYKYIVIDTPARPTVAELETLSEQSDLLVFPTMPDALSLAALAKIINVMQSKELNNYRVLLAMVPPRSNAARDAKQMLEQIGAPFFESEITRRAVCAHAALRGVTVNKVRDGENAWAEFVQLGKEILKNERK